jgi:hypothetical protein
LRGAIIRGIRTEEYPPCRLKSFYYRSSFWSGSLLHSCWSSRVQATKPSVRDVALSQSALPLLFYTLIALALPLRHADLVIVLLSWVFVVTCFAQAGVFASSIDTRRRSMASLAGVLVLFAMWIYFALRILLLI